MASTIQPPGPRKESFLLKLDISKATSQLGWWPRLTFAEAIGWTVKWYRERARSADRTAPADLCREQIGAYLRRMGV